jgi:dolichol-phosphate mannosyltransferase
MASTPISASGPGGSRRASAVPGQTSDKLLVLLPTRNERESVQPLCAEILARVPEADILFIDDDSPDGTGLVLDDLARAHACVTVIHRAAQLGVGSAHLEGIRYAYDHGYETLVTMDCDLMHSPSAIPLLVEKAHECDIAIGSRYLEPGSLPGWSTVRKSLMNLGHFLTMSMLGIPWDATSAFRAYRLSAIPRSMFDLVKAPGYAFFFESVFVAHQNGLSMREVPVTLARTEDRSKMGLVEVQRSLSEMISLAITNRANPAQFRVGTPFTEVDSSLVDPQGWNSYWERKKSKSTLGYEAIAAAYRNLIMKRHLEATIKREFPRGSRLVHAGCGSGHVDVDLHDYVKITAVDISLPALEIYSKENPKVFAVKHASIFHLPFADATLDGAYNLGVVEHFTGDELTKIFRELHRAIRPGGKLVIFWPHARASSVMVLRSLSWFLNDVMGRDTQFHPPEVSLVHNRAEAQKLLESGGFTLKSYEFGPSDGFVQAIVVGERT